MKNENDETKTKHKNEDFFKKLDSDRTKKGCEYAVLCTMLEPDNELYNEGIVDMGYRYPKMYVIRPQFFIPIISILRNAALSALQYKTQLAEVRNQNIDITNFESSRRTMTWQAASSKRRSRKSTRPSIICRKRKMPCLAASAICAWPTIRRKTLPSRSSRAKTPLCRRSSLNLPSSVLQAQ